MSPDNKKPATKEIIDSFDAFKEKLNQVFGDIDEEKTAKRAIQGLYQGGSAATYAAHFLRFVAKLNWDDDSLQTQFYKGLKEFIKDEISRLDLEFPDVNRMIDKAVRIDNRAYERRLERKGQYVIKENRGSQPKERWPEPMQIDAATRKDQVPKAEM